MRPVSARAIALWALLLVSTIAGCVDTRPPEAPSDSAPPPSAAGNDTARDPSASPGAMAFPTADTKNEPGMRTNNSTASPKSESPEVPSRTSFHPCGALNIRADRGTLEPGENVSVTVVFTNCGNGTLRVGGGNQCHRANGLQAKIPWNGTMFTVGSGDALGPGASACPGPRYDPHVVAPDETIAWQMTWNGTFWDNPCGIDVSGCEKTWRAPAPSGTYRIQANVQEWREGRVPPWDPRAAAWGVETIVRVT